MPQKHRKQIRRPVTAETSPKEAETPKQTGPLTLPEIREIGCEIVDEKPHVARKG